MAERDVDVALAEFSALRAEILTYIHAQTATFAAALTATAALGGIALNPDHERLEILLMLPFVLCALGVLHTDLSRHCYVIGSYIERELWKVPGVLRHEHSALTSWEAFAREHRRTKMRRLDVAAGVAPVVLVFVAPSVACLVVAVIELWGGPWARSLWWLTLAGAIVLVIYGFVARRVHIEIRTKEHDRDPSPPGSSTGGA